MSFFDGSCTILIIAATTLSPIFVVIELTKLLRYRPT